MAKAEKQKVYAVTYSFDPEDGFKTKPPMGVYTSLELAKKKLAKDYDMKEEEFSYHVDEDGVYACWENGDPIALISEHILLEK